MKWHEITIYTTEEASEMVTHFLHEMGAEGLTIEDSSLNHRKMNIEHGEFAEFPLNELADGRAVIKAYFDLLYSIESLMSHLQSQVAQLVEFEIDTGHPQYEYQLIDEQDWAHVWKQYFKPFQISDRIVVKPIWESFDTTPEQTIIELDPGLAFGTGTHATTAMCVRLLEKVIRGGERVIDIGTGSGILAIAAAKLGASYVYALDIDPVSVNSAKENVHYNHLQAQISVYESYLLQAIQPPSTPYTHGKSTPHLEVASVQVVVANILAEVIVTFGHEVMDVLVAGGYYITSGIIESKKQQVIDHLKQCGFEWVDTLIEGDWVAILVRKPLSN